MEKKLTTSSGLKISIGEKIAKGGEGEVFAIDNVHDILFKSYYNGMRTLDRKQKLEYMCSNRPKDISTEKFRICWPQELVYEDGEFVGFTMQKAFHASISTYHLCQTTLPKKIGTYWEKTYDRSNIQGRINRLMLSTNIAAAIQRIHASGKYIIADIKPQNLLITVDGKVSLIDMDSVQIAESDRILFKAPVSTPEYTPPEAKKILSTGQPIPESWDSFSVGILIYEILCGIHPYTGTAKSPYENLATIAEKIENNLTHINVGKTIFSVLPPPHSYFDGFSPTLQDLFKSIFQNGQISNKRPSIKQIGDTLAKEVQYADTQKEKWEYQNAITKFTQSQQQIEKLNDKIGVLSNLLSDANDKLKSAKEQKGLYQVLFFLTLLMGITILSIVIINNNGTKKASIENYEELNKKLQNENNIYRVEISTLNTRLSSFEASNRGLQSTISDYKREIENMNSKIATLEEKNWQLGRENKSQIGSTGGSVGGGQKLYIKDEITFLWDSSNLKEAEYIYTCRRGQSVKIIRLVNKDDAYVEVDGHRGYMFQIKDRLVDLN